MAQTIPHKLPNKASQGEFRLFAILKKLPDDVVVYYEPIIDNRHPDFVVIFPKLGVLLIEVKGWRLRDISGGDLQAIHVRENGHDTVHAHPLRQVREYKFLLMDRCRKDQHFSSLIQTSGPHAGGFRFPFGSFAILSNITRENLKNFPENETIFPAANVATRDQLLGWETLGPEHLVEAFIRYFDPIWTIAPMTVNQVNIVKAVLHPEILLALDFSPTRPEEPTVKVLDLKQEAQARSVGEGHRLVFGVAGSGKTVLLLARAKMVARLNPSARLLVLCFNVTFSTYLASSLSHCPTVTVMNFHTWARSHGATWNPRDDSNLGRDFLAILKAGGIDARRFDSILIDEAQDFDTDWYPCVLEAMKDPVNGDLLIVGDGSQGLYRRKKVSWKKLGIQASGRTQYLEHNYRNTLPIVGLAKLFASGLVENDEDGVCSPWVDPDKCVRTTGSAPFLLVRKSKQHEIERVARVVSDLLDGQWFGEPIEPLRPEQIGIVYRLLNKEDRPFILALRQKLQSERRDCPVVWLSEKTGERRRIGEPGVKILTMHSSKGLQFKAVILLFADQCPPPFLNTDVDEEKRLFYVALTRAEDHLVISCSGNSTGFVRQIEASGATYPVNQKANPLA